jgi:hypothetical protein
MSKLVFNFDVEESSQKIVLHTIVFFIKLPKENTRPQGENSPNLVTRFHVHFERLKVDQIFWVVCSKITKIAHIIWLLFSTA